MAIKVSLTTCGMTGLGLMYYDWRTESNCDEHIYSAWLAIITASIGVLGMSAKFCHEIATNHNCFFSPTDGIRIEESEHLAPGKSGIANYKTDYYTVDIN